MENSDNLNLPYIMASQAQKHVTHNESIRVLDALVQLSVETRNLATPPSSPPSGNRYLIAANPVNEWVGKEHQISVYQDGAWQYFEPKNGWLVWIGDEELSLIYSNNQWLNLSDILVQSIAELQNIDKIGINATADNTNRLAVSSPASLFNHQGNGHQIKLNKASQSDVSSILFQNNWSAHAEIGSIGDSNFSIKVSDDGANWKNGLIVNNTSGEVEFPSGIKHPPLSGIPKILDKYDFLYIDAVNSDDNNDGLKKNTAVKTFGALEPRMPIGRRVQIRLLSDINIDHVIRFQYSMPLIEIYGRSADDTSYVSRTVTISSAQNRPSYCGGFLFFSYASVYFRNLDVILDSTNKGAFANFYNTFGFLRTYALPVNRNAGADCALFSNGFSFVPNSHSLLSVDPSADGFVAAGLSAGADPNSDWRYPSNVSSY